MFWWIIIVLHVLGVAFAVWIALKNAPWADAFMLRLGWMGSGVGIFSILMGLLMLCNPFSKSYSTESALWIIGAGAFIVSVIVFATWYGEKPKHGETEKQVVKQNPELLLKLGYKAYTCLAIKPGNDGTIISESNSCFTNLDDRELDRLEELVSEQLQGVKDYRGRSRLGDSAKCGAVEVSQ